MPNKQPSEEDLVKIKATHNDGGLSDKAKEFVETRLAASEKAFEPLVDKIRESRRFSEEELSFRVNTR